MHKHGEHDLSRKTKNIIFFGCWDFWGGQKTLLSGYQKQGFYVYPSLALLYCFDETCRTLHCSKVVKHPRPPAIQTLCEGEMVSAQWGFPVPRNAGLSPNNNAVKERVLLYFPFIQIIILATNNRRYLRASSCRSCRVSGIISGPIVQGVVP